MSQDLQDISNIIRNEIDEGGNTKERISDALNIINRCKTESGSYNGTSKDLYDLILSIEGGYNGVASTEIINPSTQGYYISLLGGTFPNFGNIVVPEGYNILYFDNDHWAYQNINPNNPILDTEFFT